jgi:hypothetical protein
LGRLSGGLLEGATRRLAGDAAGARNTLRSSKSVEPVARCLRTASANWARLLRYLLRCSAGGAVPLR